MTLTRRFATFAAVAAAALLAAACNGDRPASGHSQFERPDDRALGDASALVVMVEYSSVACPACGYFHAQVFPAIKSEFIDTGQVRYVLREMLTGSGPLAMAGFSIARCAPEDRYFDVIDMLFHQQNAIYQAAGQPGGARDQYRAIARAVGLSEAQFNACLNDADIRRAIQDANTRHANDGVDATPSFMINGRLLTSNRPAGSSEFVYYLGNSPVEIDGERVPAAMDAETFTRLLRHFVAEAGGRAED